MRCAGPSIPEDIQFSDFDHPTFHKAIIEGVKKRKIFFGHSSEGRFRVLRANFLLGLFDKSVRDLWSTKVERSKGIWTPRALGGPPAIFLLTNHSISSPEET